MTMERIDHAAEARKYAEKSLHPSTGSPEVGLVYAQLSNTEATLALVDQQRIANLIAVAASDTMDVSRKWYPAMPLAYEHLRQEIAAALGIEVENNE